MKLIAIGGCSGAGKTVLARALRDAVGACSVLVLDSYYHAQAERTLAERERTNYDHPDSLDWALLEEHVRSLLRGEAARVPVYLFDQHTRGAHTEIVEPSAVVMIEGILTLCHEEIRKLATVRVFVETRADECLRRRLERDVRERGRTEASVLEQYRSTVEPMALDYVLPSRAHADVIVSGEQPVEIAVREILARLR